MLDENRSLLKYMLLSFITCGIYGIYYMYRMTEDINEVCGDDGEDSPNYIAVLLLSLITCGIYQWYWIYKQANRMYNAAEHYGVRIDETGTTILLWMLLGSLLCFFGTFYSWYLMFRNLNKLTHEYNERNNVSGYRY